LKRSTPYFFLCLNCDQIKTVEDLMKQSAPIHFFGGKSRFAGNVRLFIPAAFLAIVVLAGPLSAEEYELKSPDGNIALRVAVAENISYSVSFEGKEILSSSPLSLEIREAGILGLNPRLRRAGRETVDRMVEAVVPEKNRMIRDHFNVLRLDFRGGFGVHFRAYDQGIAYRFVTTLKGQIRVVQEEVRFNFPDNHTLYCHPEPGFLTHQERPVKKLKLNELGADQMAYPPAVIAVEGGPKIAITESDLQDYAGLYLKGTGGNSLEGTFPAVAVKEELARDRDYKVVERADYIATTEGNRSFPWRLMVIADRDEELIENQMVWLLAPECRIPDPSWIKPGKVAWDWWNALNLFGVDFEAGVNTATYRSFIDFAAENGIEYVILDEGWYVLGNLLEINPDIDMNAILSHGEEKGVGIILWVVWKTLEDQLEEAMTQFADWGVKGLKVDFMQRDDQWMVNYYWRIAKAAADRNMLVDFHGAYKPSGLRRAYPNVLTREGVLGLEHNKWSENVTPEHDLLIPFIRMLAGPMDFTPGAMVNMQKKNFKAVFDRPMSQGTRCHQLAMYVVYESPLQMLADSPSHYRREKESLEFLSAVPSVWDETRVLEAVMGDYVLIARRSGEEWYVGAMTDWTARELVVDFSFLDEGEYGLDYYRDGPNAQRYGNDYRQGSQPAGKDLRLKINLAPGGGWAARLKKGGR
jgi:alpha-glucosidase